jgi:allophanate hydrolase subunit 1
VDVLLNIDDAIIFGRATQILTELGSNGKTVRSIFQNAQNVHHKSIEESAAKLIQVLADIQNPLGLDYHKVREAIMDASTKHSMEKVAKIQTALTRILIDRAVYGDSNMSLMRILIKLWLYIRSSEFSEELVNRLIEELIDSSDVCSTGYAHRLVNVLSGYTDLSLSISFDEQISANLNGRLNAIIRTVPDENFQSLIINEMLIPVIHYDKRGNFLRFFRENISKIREDMYQEFKEYVSDTDYDLYFRKAIMNYEGIHY